MTQVKQPDIQLLANVVLRAERKVALTKYDDEDERWWLPGAELKAYEHPDEAVLRSLAELQLAHTDHRPSPKLHHLESFRGRRGWHVMFNYTLMLDADAPLPAALKWFDAAALPAMAHGA